MKFETKDTFLFLYQHGVHRFVAVQSVVCACSVWLNRTLLRAQMQVPLCIYCVLMARYTAENDAKVKATHDIPLTSVI